MGPVFQRRFFLGLAFFAIVPLVGYLGWSYRRANPDFREYTAPNGVYTVALPDQPRWYLESSSFEAGFVPSVSADRNTGFWAERYQVRVLWLGRSRSSGQRSPEDVALNWATNARGVSVPGGFPAAEFEIPDPLGKGKTAGRVIVLRDFAYEMTVTGRGISLSDRRVRHFFDSFRIGR
jgi:hypothetical protein